MCQQIKEGEEDGERFLHACKAVEWPFPVKLQDRLKHGRISRHAAVCNDVLAYIVAIRRASPEEQAEMKCCQVLLGEQYHVVKVTHEWQGFHVGNFHRRKSALVSIWVS